MRCTTAVAVAATLAAASTLQVPRSVRIGHQVTVYASGRVARAITNGPTASQRTETCGGRVGQPPPSTATTE
jgi:hypothetical protein